MEADVGKMGALVSRGRGSSASRRRCRRGEEVMDSDKEVGCPLGALRAARVKPKTGMHKDPAA